MIHRYRFISLHYAVYGVTRLCRVLAVKRRQGYYEWVAAQPARHVRARVDDELVAEIRIIHAEHGGSYGSPRVHDELVRRGRRVNRKRVERLMRERCIVGVTRRRRRSLTKPDARAVPAPDLISRNFTSPTPGQRFVGDITYLPTGEGWLYLATVIDLFNREVVGHAMADHMRADLVCDAVDLAHKRGLVGPKAIFHSDRGSQYTSTQFRAKLGSLDLKASMGRTGSCYDNAAAESFFASLKAPDRNQGLDHPGRGPTGGIRLPFLLQPKPSTFDAQETDPVRGPCLLSSAPRPRGIKPSVRSCGGTSVVPKLWSDGDSAVSPTGSGTGRVRRIGWSGSRSCRRSGPRHRVRVGGSNASMGIEPGPSQRGRLAGCCRD